MANLKDRLAANIKPLLVAGLSAYGTIVGTAPPSTATAAPVKTEARASTFEEQLKEAVNDRKIASREAKEYFDKGEVAFKAHQYGKAAGFYETSTEKWPTMSAYLNAGVSFTMDSNYPKAKNNYQKGLKLAQAKGNKKYVAVFRSNMEACDKEAKLSAKTKATIRTTTGHSSEIISRKDAEKNYRPSDPSEIISRKDAEKNYRPSNPSGIISRKDAPHYRYSASP